MAGNNRRNRGTGEEPTVKERRTRKQKSGVGSALMSGIIVGLSLLAIWGAYQYYLKWDAKRKDVEAHNRQVREENARREREYVYDKPSAVGSGTHDRAPAAPSAAAPKELKRAATSRSAIIEESPEFKSLTQSATKLFKETKYNSAADTFSQALSEKAPPERIEKAKESLEICRTFAKVMEGIEPSPESDSAGLATIFLKNGSNLRAKITRKSDSSVSFVRDNNIKGTLPMSVVKEIKEVDPKKLEAERKEKLAEAVAEAEAEKNSSLAYYLAATEAVKLNFPQDSHKLLLKAYKLDRDGGTTLGDTVREYKAAKLFRQGAYFYSLGIPQRAQKRFDKLFAMYDGTRAATAAREILEEAKRKKILDFENQKRIDELEKKRKEEERRRREAAERERKAAESSPRSVVSGGDDDEEGFANVGLESSPDTISGKDTENIKLGDKYYAEGSVEYDKGMTVSSARKRDKHYSNAIKLFEKCMNYYMKAQKKDPNNADLESRIQEAGMKLYWSRKTKSLGL